jgi:DNA-directed RNA polymerase specialized sigma24 family protein
MAEPERGLTVAEFMSQLEAELAKTTPEAAIALLEQSPNLGRSVIEALIRDPSGRALLLPEQVTAEAGTVADDFDFANAAITGLDEALTEMKPDLVESWERLQAGLGTGMADKPLTAYHHLVEQFAQLFIEDPDGARKAAVPGLLATSARAAEAELGGASTVPPVLPAEALAAIAGIDRKYLDMDARRAGVDPDRVGVAAEPVNPLVEPPFPEVARLQTAEAALWQTEALRKGAPGPGLGLRDMKRHITRLKSGTRRALVADARAEVQEARSMPGRSKGKYRAVERDAVAADGTSRAELRDASAEIELIATDRLMLEQAVRERKRAGVSDRDWELLLLVKGGNCSVADAAFRIGMTPKTAQKAMERAAARIRDCLGAS